MYSCSRYCFTLIAKVSSRLKQFEFFRILPRKPQMYSNLVHCTNPTTKVSLQLEHFEFGWVPPQTLKIFSQSGYCITLRSIGSLNRSKLKILLYWIQTLNPRWIHVEPPWIWVGSTYKKGLETEMKTKKNIKVQKMVSKLRWKETIPFILTMLGLSTWKQFELLYDLVFVW